MPDLKKEAPEGLVHLYIGDGKGKTTAAVGLAVRMAGAGKKVLKNRKKRQNWIFWNRGRKKYFI